VFEIYVVKYVHFTEMLGFNIFDKQGNEFASSFKRQIKLYVERKRFVAPCTYFRHLFSLNEYF